MVNHVTHLVLAASLFVVAVCQTTDSTYAGNSTKPYFNNTGYNTTPTDASCPSGIVDLIVYSHSHTLQSVNYPNNYPNDAVCRWRLTSPAGTFIKIEILDYGIEYDGNCEFDSLNVFDGRRSSSRRLGTLCGSSTPGPTYQSTSNASFILFFSDGSVSGKGFRLAYHYIRGISNQTLNSTTESPYAGNTTATSFQRNNTTPYSAECGGSLVYRNARDHPHILKSPNYPNNYPDNANCRWRIYSPIQRVIRIEVLDYNIEAEFSCRYDNLNIHDGPYSTSRQLARLCGSSASLHVYKSTSNVVYINFYSDGSRSGRGFQLTYQYMDSNSTKAFS